ncbi:hypothetical protein KIPB_013512, partial [Kipferlia bialata]|eukprot:g13512.t1
MRQFISASKAGELAFQGKSWHKASDFFADAVEVEREISGSVKARIPPMYMHDVFLKAGLSGLLSLCPREDGEADAATDQSPPSPSSRNKTKGMACVSVMTRALAVIPSRSETYICRAIGSMLSGNLRVALGDLTRALESIPSTLHPAPECDRPGEGSDMCASLSPKSHGTMLKAAILTTRAVMKHLGNDFK